MDIITRQSGATHLVQNISGPGQGLRVFRGTALAPRVAAMFCARHCSVDLGRRHTDKKMRAVHALQTATARCLGRAVSLAIAALMCASVAVNAAPLRIVAIGASNTHGWYVGNQGAYPAQLQALLRAKGIDAQITNAGVPFETTGMMLRRIEKDVPNGTDIVILEPGGNDRRFFVSREQRAANIAEMEHRLQARSISVIVYDEEMPLRYRAFDLMHFTDEGHAIIAAALLPRVMEILNRRRDDVLRRRNATRPALTR
jgi:acyl-CoA thioesterase-1